MSLKPYLASHKLTYHLENKNPIRVAYIENTTQIDLYDNEGKLIYTLQANPQTSSDMPVEIVYLPDFAPNKNNRNKQAKKVTFYSPEITKDDAEYIQSYFDFYFFGDEPKVDANY